MSTVRGNVSAANRHSCPKSMVEWQGCAGKSVTVAGRRAHNHARCGTTGSERHSDDALRNSLCKAVLPGFQ